MILTQNTSYFSKNKQYFTFNYLTVSLQLSVMNNDEIDA